MLRLFGVRKEFGDRTLFKNISFSLAPGHRIALVGANGSGKSTLLRICADLTDVDAGSVRLERGAELSYLPQNIEGEELSGGEKQKIALSVLFRKRPDIFLLDEPTNNLDEVCVRWLERLIKGSSAAFLIVSHDRHFLDCVTNQTFEIDQLSSSLTEYGGSFSEYRQAKESALKNQWRLYCVQEQKYKQIQKDALAIKEQARHTEKNTQNDYIRGRAKKVAAKAKAREKRLQHMMQEETRIDKPRDRQRIRIDFAHSQLSRRALLELKDVTFSFADSVVLRQLNLQLYTGQRVVITGANGAGKSCLLNMIAGNIAPRVGSIYRSSLGRISYFQQEQESWPKQIRLIDWFTEQAQISQSETNVRTFLHRFLFSGDDVYKDVSSLSCGERTRLKLAAIMIQNPDLILFDEPTNHLDIESIESIEDALSQFNGALLVVSHDEAFREAIEPELYWHVENQYVQVRLPKG